MNFLAGLLFAFLWGSASTAGKYGFQSVEPLVLYVARFFLAGLILITYSSFRYGRWTPAKSEWGPITLFSILNTVIYLGVFAYALEMVAAGITTLTVALNPLMISVFSSLILRRQVPLRTWIGITLGMLGVGVSVFPLLQTVHVNALGLGLLVVCMISYSLAAVYYARQGWKSPSSLLNGWQALIGGIILLPICVGFSHRTNMFDQPFLLSLIWLAIPVSVGSIQLWLYLIRKDAVKASLWLFICPLFGFLLSHTLLSEPFTVWTAAGTLIVIGGMYVGSIER